MNSSTNSVFDACDFYTKWRGILNPKRATKIPTEKEEALFVKRAEEAASEFATLTVQQMVDLCPPIHSLDVYDFIDEEGKEGTEEMFELQIWNAVTKLVPETTKRHVREAAEAKQEREMERKAADAWHRYGARYPW